MQRHGVYDQAAALRPWATIPRSPISVTAPCFGGLHWYNSCRREPTALKPGCRHPARCKSNLKEKPCLTNVRIPQPALPSPRSRFQNEPMKCGKLAAVPRAMARTTGRPRKGNCWPKIAHSLAHAAHAGIDLAGASALLQPMGLSAHSESGPTRRRGLLSRWMGLLKKAG